MNLLLDTHALLWWLDDHPSLSTRTRALIADPEHVVYLSAVVMWEIRIKAAIGKLSLPDEFRATVDRQGLVELAVTVDHTEVLATLPLHHRDPFDRMLVAQALYENLTVVTADAAFQRYGVQVIPATG